MIDWAQNFDLTNGINILRIACGLFFIPHIVGKFTQREYSMGFFEKAGMKPPAAFLWFALIVEVIFVIGLVLGIYTTYVAIVAAIHLVVAGIAVWRVTEGKWLWNLGGAEYCFFWAIACIVVAMHG
jgi:putative oxidoreductase